MFKAILNKISRFGQVTRGRAAYIQDWLSGRDVSGGMRKVVLGSKINEQTALGISTVYTCATIIAETLATTPLYLMKMDGRKRIYAEDQDEYWLFQDAPNPNCSPAQYLEQTFMDVILNGNTISWQCRDNRGRVKELWPMRWSSVNSMERLGRTIKYNVTANGAEIPVENGLRMDLERGYDAFHYYRFSRNGATGMSLLESQKESFGLMLTLEEFQTNLFGKGLTARGALKTPDTNRDLDDVDLEKYRESFREFYSGSDNAGNVLILPGGYDFNDITLSPADAEMIGTYDLSERKIAQVFKMPLYKLQNHDHSTFSNVEHLAIEFVQTCIRPWAETHEQALNSQVLTPYLRAKGYRFRYDLDSLERGDKKSRYDGYTSGINAGWMTRNEAREIENYDPLDGLDEPLSPLNMATQEEKDAQIDAQNAAAEAQKESNKAAEDQQQPTNDPQNDAKQQQKQAKEDLSQVLVDLFADVVRRSSEKLKAKLDQGKYMEKDLADQKEWMKNQVKLYAPHLLNDSVDNVIEEISAMQLTYLTEYSRSDWPKEMQDYAKELVLLARRRQNNG